MHGSSISEIIDFIKTNSDGFLDVAKKIDFWRELAKEIDGDFKVIVTKSRDLNKFRLKYTYKNNLIILTETDTKPLFIETNLIYNKKDNFYLEITESGIIESLLSKLSSTTVKLKNADFNRKYLIKSNNRKMTTLLLDDPKLSRFLLHSGIFYLEGSAKKNKEFNLKFNVNRQVNSYEYLKSILLIFCEFIDQLEINKITKSAEDKIENVIY